MTIQIFYLLGPLITLSFLYDSYSDLYVFQDPLEITIYISFNTQGCLALIFTWYFF